ncbi:MAG: rhodanese-like domain-containing protein [Parcubacteria group bacterium]|jgi:rhodanese-related sulfurtransferase
MQNEKNQHKIFVVGFSLVVIIILWFLLKPLVLNLKGGQSSKDEQKANEEILKAPSTMPEDLLKAIQDKSKIFLADISSSDEFNRGHIATAVNVQADKLDKSFFVALGADRTSNILIVNQGDNLTDLATVVNKIVSDGFVNAKYLRGGIPGWQEKGYPLVSSGGSGEDSAKVKNITIDEIKKDAEITPALLQFLDVRSKNDFAKEHIVGAINLSLSELETRKSEIPVLKKTIIYGSNENDGFQAAAVLFDLNFFNVYKMNGGIEDWKAAGGKVTSGK